MVCFSIAFVFWIFNSLSNDFSTTISYPVKLIYNQKKIIPLQPVTKKIDLAVTGYGWTLLSLTLGLEVKPIIITLRDLNEENIILSNALFTKSKETLSRITVNQVLNDYLYFDIDKIAVKKVQLKLDVKKLALPANRTITHPVISPSFVECTGPRTFISTIPDTITFPITDSFVESDFSELVQIDYKPSRFVTLSTNEVFVSFKIK